MTKKIKKGQKGAAANYLTRGESLKKLQSSLKDFRRLCILKGVYPRDPKKKIKAKDKTYYHTKDITYLQHEPLKEAFHSLKVHDKKIHKALVKGNYTEASYLKKNKPQYNLYHIIKERYATFVHALRDLDDALSTLALFSVLQCDIKRGVSKDQIKMAQRVFDEFLLYVIQKQCLRKVFCSIKGFYIQVKCLGQNILFLIPHEHPQELPLEVDFRVMATFLELYTYTVQAVNYKLFNLENWKYPPEINRVLLNANCRFMAYQNICLPLTETTSQKTIDSENNPDISNICEIDNSSKESSSDNQSSSKSTNNSNVDGNVSDTQAISNQKLNEKERISYMELMELSETDRQIQSLFTGLSFFLSREIPRLPITLMLLSCGADIIGWDGPQSPIQFDSSEITHYVIDRPLTENLIALNNSRSYVQPQWIFDSVNKAKLMSAWQYRPEQPLPPHLSPFVELDEEKLTCLPVLNEAENEQEDKLSEQSTAADDEFEEASFFQKLENEKNNIFGKQGNNKSSLNEENAAKKRKEIEDKIEYERRRAFMSKKHKHLLDKIQRGKQTKKRKILK